MIVGYLEIAIITIDKTTIQKLSGNIEDLDSIIKQFEKLLNNILHLNITEYLYILYKHTSNMFQDKPSH